MHRLTSRALLALLLAPGLAGAQEFVSGSTGSDGALDIPANTTVVFDPTTFDPPLDPDGDNVYHFTTITIGAGASVRLSTRTLPEGKPVVWLASGAVTIAGTLDLGGETGHRFDATAAPAFAGAGGYSGGVARRATTVPATPGNGPGAGLVGALHGGNASHVILGQNITGMGPSNGTYGNDFLLPLIGGSGGAGGSTQGTSPGGGAGGGAILIASSVSIRLDGQIRASGGTGGVRSSSGGLGGGGSGGAVRLVAPTLEGAGTINAAGGTNAGAQIASYGRVRLEAFRHRSTFTVTPTTALMTPAAPGPVFLPDTAPVIRVVRVDGQAVVMSPTGSFVTPDVTIAAPAAVTVELEARHVPLGTVLSLTFQPETGTPFTATSTPLAGTVELSTATVQAQFPSGPTRVFVRATWTP